MNNLDLLERHRRKVAFILAAIVLLFLYLGVFVFEWYLIHMNKATFSDFLPLWFGILIATPVIYSILSFAACRLMHKVYKPIRESIVNLENFTTNVNHEFKTSLTEIISSLELGKIIEKQSEYTPQALQSAKRLNVILDSLVPLVEYSNSSYRRKNTDIIKVFEGIMSGYSEQIVEKDISLKKDFPKTLWTHVDIGPLSICFQNIFANAVKYNVDTGEIQVSIEKDFFEIYDSGVGVDPENMDKIFERSFQESKASEGLGVGLSLVKSICDIYEWHIDIDSKKDEYTKIKISF